MKTLNEAATKARVALDRAVTEPERARRVDRRAPRPERAMDERPRGRATAIAVVGLGARRQRRPAIAAVPGRSALAGGGAISSRFGKQPSSRFGTAIVRNGIEIASAEGQPIRAAHEGVVAFAGQFTGYGNLVIVEHGERAFSLYGHLSAMQVAQGERIAAQSILGRSGLNPNGTPVLYFELRVDGKPVDPLQWLQKGMQ